MKIQNIAYFNHQIKQNNNTAQKNVFAQQMDTFELSNKNKVTFCGVSDFEIKAQAKLLKLKASKMYKTGCMTRDDSFHIVRNSRHLQKRADSILEASKEIFKYANKEFKKGEVTDFKPIREPETNEIIKEFYDGNNSVLIMEEYDTYGRTKKKIEFDEQTITVFIKGKKSGTYNVLTFDKLSGELIQFLKEAKVGSDRYSAQEQFIFDGNNLSAYNYKTEVIIGKSEKAYERYMYCDKKLTRYLAEWQYSENGIEKSSEDIEFVDEQIKKASIDVVDEYNGFRIAQEEYIYGEETDLMACMAGLKQPQDNTSATIKTMFKFGDRGLEKAYSNVVANSRPKSTQAEKLYYFEDENPTKCAVQYESKNGREIFYKFVKL